MNAGATILLVAAGLLAGASTTGAPTAQAGSAQQEAEPTDPGAPETPEALAERLESLYHGAFDLDDMRDPFETYLSTGVASERVAAYLREAAETTARLREMPLTKRGVGREASGPITHLRVLRIESRALALLGRSAGMRGDRTAMTELLTRASRRALVAASDGTITSSLVAESIADNALRMIEDAIAAGHVDQASAATLRSGLRGLDEVDALGFGRAIAGESAFLEGVVVELEGLDPAARAVRLGEIAERSGFGRIEVEPISDDELARGHDSLSRFYDGLSEAFSLEDPQARAAEIGRLVAERGKDPDEDPDENPDENPDEDDPIGHLSLPTSAFARIERRLAGVESLLASLDASLERLAAGTWTPEDAGNAAPLYARAAEAVRTLSPEAQEAIETLRRIPADAPEEIVREARARIDALRGEVVAPILLAARFGRADFLPRAVSGYGRTVRLAEPGSIGSTGAVRVMLADALDLRPRREGEPAPVDAAIAVLAAVRHYANAGRFVHSLCAEVMARDLAEALAMLDARGALDAAARERIRGLVARFEPGDPLGWRRATEAERTQLVHACAETWEGVDRARLERLGPNETLCFVLVAVALPDGCLVRWVGKEPTCIGPLVDLCPHFDATAMNAALTRWSTLMRNEERPVSGAEALARFEPTVPLDVVARIHAQDAALAALARFGEMPAAAPPVDPAKVATREVRPDADADVDVDADADAAPATRDELVARLNELYSAAFNDDESPEPDPWEAYHATGVASPRIAAYLSEAATIAARLESMPRPRPMLDFSQGTALLLPHLGSMRHEARAYVALARAAGLRGDRTAMTDFYRRAAALALDAASDGTLISSLVAQGIGSTTIAGAQKAIDEASLDQTSAAALRETIRPLGGRDPFRFAVALERERGMLEVEADRLRAIDPALRAAHLRERSGGGRLSGSDEPDPPYTDEALDRDLDVISRYYAAAGPILGDPDRASAGVALERLEDDLVPTFGESLSESSLGPLGTMVVPPDSIGVFHRRLSDHDERHARVDASLRALASGDATPESRADAGPLYVRAAEAMRRLGPAEQEAIEVLRRIGPHSPPEIAREARERIRALREFVVDPILEASKRERAEFVRPAWREVARALFVAEPGSIGSIGAMRLVLADALDVRPRGERDVPPGDAIVAVLRAVALYADAQLIVHSLCAELMSRDLVEALSVLEARGAIDAATRERIRSELARFRPGDPFGWRRAVEMQREEVVRNSLSNYGIDRAALGRLDANTTLFLLAATLAADDGCLALRESGTCRCEGPLLDLRPWFDVEAIRSARAQWLALVESGLDPSERYARLAPAVPLDVEARTRGQTEVFAALARFGEPPDRR